MDTQTLTSEEIILSGLADVDGVEGRRRGRYVHPKINELGANSFRKQALERIKYLPKDVQRDLLTGKAQLSDKQYYAVAALNGNSVDVFATNQAKAPGVSNFADSKLDHYFICSALRILYSSGSSSRFGDIMPKELADGEVTMKHEQEWLQDFPIEAFSNAGNEITEDAEGNWGVIGNFETSRPMGLILLSNPKILKPNVYNEMLIKLTGSLSSGSVKGIMIGTEIIPA